MADCAVGVGGAVRGWDSGRWTGLSRREEFEGAIVAGVGQEQVPARIEGQAGVESGEAKAVGGRRCGAQVARLAGEAAELSEHYARGGIASARDRIGVLDDAIVAR